MSPYLACGKVNADETFILQLINYLFNPAAKLLLLITTDRVQIYAVLATTKVSETGVAGCVFLIAVRNQPKVTFPL